MSGEQRGDILRVAQVDWEAVTAYMNALNLGIPPAARLAGEPKASPA